jgi:putative aldouronate transport system permease protein
MRKFRRASGEVAYQVVAFLLVTIVMLSALIPLIYAVGLSFTTEHEIMETGGLQLFPRHPTVAAYRFLVAGGALGIVGHSFLISVVRTVAGTSLSIVLIFMGAYALAQKWLPGRGVFIFMVLAAMMISGGMIPTYLVIRRLHLHNTLWSLILPGAIDGFSFLVIKSFIENLPKELIDSAQIDGAGEVRRMVSICMPLTAPAIAAIALFTSVGHWNAWFDALIYIDDQNLFPFQLFLRNVEGMMDFVLQRSGLSFIARVTSDGIRMATVVIAVVPILMVYPFLQKYFIKGIYMGSTKG